jgi:hypothetical protein
MHSALKLKRLQQGNLQQKMEKMSILRNGSITFSQEAESAVALELTAEEEAEAEGER